MRNDWRIAAAILNWHKLQITGTFEPHHNQTKWNACRNCKELSTSCCWGFNTYSGKGYG